MGRSRVCDVGDVEKEERGSGEEGRRGACRQTEERFAGRAAWLGLAPSTAQISAILRHPILTIANVSATNVPPPSTVHIRSAHRPCPPFSRVLSIPSSRNLRAPCSRSPTPNLSSPLASSGHGPTCLIASSARLPKFELRQMFPALSCRRLRRSPNTRSSVPPHDLRTTSSHS